MRRNNIPVSLLLALSLLVCLIGSAPTIYLPLISKPDPTPTPEPKPPVYVDDNYSVFERPDEIKVAGEVVNNSNSPITGIRIETIILDNQNQIRNFKFPQFTITTLARDERTCFDFSFTPPDGYSSFVIGTPSSTNWINRPDLLLKDVQVDVQYPYPYAPNVYEYIVYGSIQNDNPFEVQRLDAAITVYKDGTVFDCINPIDDLEYSISEYIDPGGIGNFSIRTTYNEEMALPENLRVKVQIMSYSP